MINALTLSSYNVSQTQTTFCPAFREVLTLPPEILGRAVALSKHGFEVVKNNPLTQVVGEVFSKMNQYVHNITNGLLDLRGLGYVTYYKRREVIYGALFAVAAVQKIYQMLREDPLSAAVQVPGFIKNTFIESGRQAAQFAWKATRTITHLPIDVLLAIPKIPYEIFNLGKTGLGLTFSASKFVLTSKVALTAAGYLGVKEAYKYLCEDYEASIQSDPQTKPLDFLDRTLYSYNAQIDQFPKSLVKSWEVNEKVNEKVNLEDLVKAGTDINTPGLAEALFLKKEKENLEALVKAGTYINTPGLAEALFCKAVLQENVEMIKILIKQVKKVGNHLARVIILGHVKQLEALIKGGADINAKHVLGMNFLHYAIVFGKRRQEELVEALIKGGVDINAKDKFDRSPLIALESDVLSGKRLEIVEMLVNAGAQTDGIKNAVIDDHYMNLKGDACRAKLYNDSELAKKLRLLIPKQK